MNFLFRGGARSVDGSVKDCSEKLKRTSNHSERLGSNVRAVILFTR